MTGFPFAAAVQAGDIDAAAALLGPDVVFRSPVVHTPYRGREPVMELLRAVFEVFEDFRYIRQVGDERHHVLEFRTRVGEREIEGADFLTVGEDGLIEEFVVMVRPLSGTLALAEAMRAKLAPSAD